jgi:two-component system sensor histidine kinase UhpB
MTLSLGLLASLLVGIVLTCLHAVTKVRTEMVAALTVGRHHVENQVNDGETQIEPNRLIAQIVGDFNGDRHLRAVLLSAAGKDAMRSTLLPPDDPAPRAFYDLVAGAAMQPDVALPSGFAALGQLWLETDPHNEVAEAWSDFKLMLSILGLFFAVGLGLMIWIVRRALAPLRDLCLGFGRIGAGEYDARVMTMTYRELAPVQQGFNEMAARLARIEMHNRSLQAPIQQVQEEERAEMARDLHDEIAPFLFAVGTDAALIQQFVLTRRIDDIDSRAAAIVDSVRHMQRHLKTVLSRLMPNALVDLSLPGAIEQLVTF